METLLIRPIPSGHMRARVLVTLLAIAMLIDVVAVASDLGEIQLLADAYRADELTAAFEARAAANDARQALIGLAQGGLYFLTIVPFLMWWHRAYRNLAVVSREKPKYSPGMAVGSWFIPFINLVRPYQIAKEMWQRSIPANDPLASARFSSSAGVVALWWLFWIGTNIAANLLFRVAFEAETLDELAKLSRMQLAADGASVVLDILAIMVVRGIDTRQQFTRAQLEVA